MYSGYNCLVFLMDVGRYQWGWSCFSNEWFSYQNVSEGIVIKLEVGLDAGPRRVMQTEIYMLRFLNRTSILRANLTIQKLVFKEP